ncbi:hypothetical protein [Candidatus Mesenet endosymbiont of Agriotes lineatus]|uniref:hypothetical protein n=1 Tax=Candidatus Mesenet endosymbiont of Agriotes lineatus TaxID=3077948 RepID=UPI0030CC2C32
MVESNTRDITPNNIRSNLASTLELEVKKLDYSKLKAGEDNQSAQSGETMYVDLSRMGFVINGKSINQNLLSILCEGAKTNRLDYEKIASSSVDEIKFFCIGFNNKKLISDDQEKNYILFLQEAYKAMFEHVKVEVPNESIIKELIINCNQAGYDALLHTDVFIKTAQHNFMALSPKKTTYIDYINHDCVKIRSNMVTPLGSLDGTESKQILLNSSLEFKLQSQGDKVKYTNGKLSLTLPKELAQDKDLLSRIIEWFKELFGIEVKGSVIKHSFDNAEVDKPQAKMEKVEVESSSSLSNKRIKP